MQEIVPQLHISDAPATRKLPADHDYDEVVTLGYFNQLGYTIPEASTTGDEFAFRDGPHDYADFEAAVEYVLSALERGDRVLVHCQAGVSRSCGVCCAVLTDHEDISLPDAYQMVREAREIVNPAPEIVESMEQFAGEQLVPLPSGFHEYTSSED
jgi:protein-tyrosine phosphatase